MKTNRMFALAAVMSMMAAMAFESAAQENGNRDENGQIVRGPYETNRLFDNVWIGVAGGINLF